MNKEMCVYKITLSNGKEYFIETEENNAKKFIEDVCKGNKIHLFKIACSEKDNKADVVAIVGKYIASIEYTVGMQ